MEKVVKIVLATLLFLCLTDMPYGYYQFVRFAATALFIYFAYTANEKGSKKEGIVFLVLAALFQPFFKVSLGRELWNVVDVIVAVGLIVSLFVKIPPPNEK